MYLLTKCDREIGRKYLIAYIYFYVSFVYGEKKDRFILTTFDPLLLWL